MNASNPLRFVVPLAGLFTIAASAATVTFTNDAVISSDSTDFDGQDIVVTNCTLIVDGHHAFASVQLLRGGNLTHSFSPTGLLTNILHITAEQHLLSATNPAVLHAGVVTNTVVVADASGTNTLNPGTDYTFTEVYGLSALVLAPGSGVPEGTLILVSYDASVAPTATGLDLAVSADFDITLGGTINAYGKGYGGGYGAGAGTSRATNSPYVYTAGSGGGYGGYGGASSSGAPGGGGYGEIATPHDKGSGGGPGLAPGGSGGGAIKLFVGGRLRVDGLITASGANGTNANSGGGSGGGIWLSAQTLAGTGYILANGGYGEPYNGGGGGGGRIAFSCTTNRFTGTLSAQGGVGAGCGGAGTIYIQSGNGIPQLLVDNGGCRGTNTPLALIQAPAVTVANGAIVQFTGSSVRLSSLAIRSNASLTLPGARGPLALTLSINNDAVIEAGGAINLDAKGYGSSGTVLGPGAGGSGISGLAQSFYIGGGGAYGGYGGAGAGRQPGGKAYGSIWPSLSDLPPGSAGGRGGFVPDVQAVGGAGGGALRLNVGGTLSVNGLITANGADGPVEGSGGGAGGAISLNAGRLTGSGSISANGGSGGLLLGGGGGGGRIAVQAKTNDFTGRMTAYGGQGANNGGAGTLCLASATGEVHQVVVDNGGQTGTNTLLSANGVPSPYDLAIEGGAVVDVTGSYTIFVGSLSVGSNSWLSSSLRGAQTISAASASIQAGGGIRMLPGGYLAGQGQGTGRLGGGGGYGGYGGNGLESGGGGNSYGSATEPNLPGSDGGTGQGGLGGSGAGALWFTVQGTLALDGRIAADGGDAVSGGGGGGSGGSVWLKVGTLTGSGLISANGGAGDLPSGGGGGGGRIAITYSTNQFQGTMLALGGAGANYGGAGTIYWKANQSPSGQLVVDNAGHSGTNTTLGQIGLFDLKLSAGAIVVPPTYAQIQNLFLARGSMLTFPPAAQATIPAPVTLNVARDAVIEEDAEINLDGKGSPAGMGRGTGFYASGVNLRAGYGTGGGYGGYGGAAGTNSLGGIAYGSTISPTDPGSGGGGRAPYALAGAGGGALRMNVQGTLTVHGRISADGTAGLSGGGGGGSGGSLQLTVGRFSGTGLISACGGPGDIPDGGGGGGGRIALLASTNLFSGTVRACGGAGSRYGGAGTIYRKETSSGTSEVLVDNGGPLGTNTLVDHLEGLPDMTVTGGATAAFWLTSTSVRNLVVDSNSWVTYVAQPKTVPITFRFFLSSATVQNGGGITLSGRGYAGGQGPGQGGPSMIGPLTHGGGGGGYGGCGGNGLSSGASGGRVYGSLYPIESPGSGGGGYPVGGAGGGALSLTCRGSLVLDGIISADGAPGFYAGGGGSGGGISLDVASLSGSGLISANGGPGDLEYGGGGGGGRIAILTQTNHFLGRVTAHGGAGSTYGGAGTICSQVNANPTVNLLVDNGGAFGANTPLPSQLASRPLDLVIGGRAVVQPQAMPFTLNSVVVDSGASLIQSNLHLRVASYAIVGTNASISADYLGYSGPKGGPGAGQMSSRTSGSGGGYGGAGGASASGVRGGQAYGSMTQPTDFGSRGGLFPVATNLSQGGGAIRIEVTGPLTLDGRISANGNDAAYESAGGGAGGSVWLTVRTLQGSGLITANGGAGNPFEGGGGGGGRIALYSGTYAFGGTYSAFGGEGATFGEDGTVVQGTPPAPLVLDQVPNGVVSFAVSNVDLRFDSPMDFASVTGADVLIETPFGPLPQTSITVSGTAPSTLHIGFPPQTIPGLYQVSLGTRMQSLYGANLAQPYLGRFIVQPPVISGHVTDNEGLPVPYVTLRTTSAIMPAMTDSNGFYTLEVLPGWSGTVTPSKGAAQFLPQTRTYAGLSADAPNQDFVIVSPAAFAVTRQLQDGNLRLSWQGMAGLSYQLFRSTNLIDWVACQAPWIGTNGPISVSLPVGAEPSRFYRVRAGYY